MGKGNTDYSVLIFAREGKKRVETLARGNSIWNIATFWLNVFRAFYFTYLTTFISDEKNKQLEIKT